MTASIQASLNAASPAPAPCIVSGAYEIAIERELETVKPLWLELFAQLRTPTLFQHIAWHEAFLASRYQPKVLGQTLFVCVKHNGNIVAILPLAYRRGRRHGLPLRIVELLFPTDMGVRDFPIADDANGGEILDAVLNEALPRAGFRWDIAELPDLAETSATYAAFAGYSGRKLAVYHHDSNRLKCAHERSQCFAHVSKSHVKKTKRKRKNLDALGSVECELITDPAAMPQALQLFIELEDAGWKGKEQTSLHHDLPQKTFYESLIANSTPSLNCCMAVMRLNGVPIAANLCTRTGDTLWMLKITYSDELQDYSPGNLMLLYLLEHFAEDNGIEYISFITGGEWTWRWHPERHSVFYCTVYTSTVFGHSQMLIEKGVNWLRTAKHRLKSSHQPNLNEPLE